MLGALMSHLAGLEVGEEMEHLVLELILTIQVLSCFYYS